ncbi:MAG: hypothetical protein QOH04_2909 [Sphingomonadales bacterium]|jgi:uncharacterized NAD(P)/FAD-binding protein YdhS|nr:hypothetical protein [Sphingomonadales bacterium]
MAAVEAKRACPAAEVSLVEKSGRFAAGAAYGTVSPSHLLNVRARSMSAFADAPDDFAAWLARDGLGGSETFARRRDYARYLAEILDPAEVRRIEGEAVAIEEGALVLASGERLAFDALVLAGGNYPGRTPARVGIETLDDPWGPGGAEAIARLADQADDLLLLGTGLTMVDVALSLADAGFRGRITAVSRRGLVPRPHEEPPSPPLEAPPPARLGALIRYLRGLRPWRAGVDSLRPYSIDLWRGFTPAERSRFLRHARPWWDVHRHRIAPPVAARIAALREAGRLEVLAGRVRQEGGEIAIALRGGGALRRRFAAAVNCTGPEGAIARVEDPLIRQLLASGLARPDPLGAGLDVDEDSLLVGADGNPSPRLFAVGPLTRGAFWEIVAVPDIRRQVRDVVRAIALLGERD